MPGFVYLLIMCIRKAGEADQLYVSVYSHAEKRYQKTTCILEKLKRFEVKVCKGEAEVRLPTKLTISTVPSIRE